jgi:acyl-CoA thioesterase I
MTEQRALFFGDDVVAGVGDPTGLGLVGRIVAASFAADLPITAYNLGAQGDTSVGVSRRWRKEAASRVARGSGWRPVFCFGASDTIIDGDHQRVDEQASTQALQKVLVRTDEDGLGPLVVGPPPLGDAARRGRILALSERFSNLCVSRGARYIETAAVLSKSPTWLECGSCDLGRPGEAGYRELAALIVSEGWLAWLRGDEGRPCQNAPALPTA